MNAKKCYLESIAIPKLIPDWSVKGRIYKISYLFFGRYFEWQTLLDLHTVHPYKIWVVLILFFCSFLVLYFLFSPKGKLVPDSMEPLVMAELKNLYLYLY